MNVRILVWAGVVSLLAVPAGAVEDRVVYLSSAGVTDVAVAADRVHWSSDGGAGTFRPGDSTYVSLSQADGLSSNRLSAVAVDSSGAVWYGTVEDGISWTAGTTWHVINTYGGLPSNEITSLDAWGDGVWIGTPAGACFFEGDTRVETVTPANGLASASVLGVSVDASDRVWFATAGGLSVRDGTSWTQHFPGWEVRAVAADAAGRTWVSTSGGVYVSDGAGWQSMVSGLPDLDVFSFVVAGGVVWAGTEAGPAWFDEGSEAWVAETDGLLGTRVSALGYREGVGLWAGVRGEGIAVWDGNAWEPRRPSSPAANHVTHLDVSPDGTLWCATGSDGNQFPMPEGVDPRGLMACADESWLDYRAGVTPLSSDNVYRVARDGNDGVWIGTWGAGLLHFDPSSGVWDTLSFETGHLFQNYVSALVAGPQGEVWFGEYIYGIGVVDPEGTVTHFGLNDGLPTLFFRSLAVDSLGRVWAGSYGLEGSSDLPTLTRLDPHGTFADKGDDEVQVYSATNWGGSVPVHAIACGPGGDVWLGVDGGIAWTNGSSWLDVDEACAGSVAGQVRSIAVDRTGGTWFATSQGLGLWKGGTWTLYGTSGGGLAVDDVMSLAYDRARDELWIGTWGGGVSLWVLGAPDSEDTGGAAYAYPNPFRADRGDANVTFVGLSDSEEIEIFTLDGQRVAVVPAGAHAWNATCEGGGPVSPGLYLFVGRDSTGEVRTGRLAVVR